MSSERNVSFVTILMFTHQNFLVLFIYFFPFLLFSLHFCIISSFSQVLPHPSYKNNYARSFALRMCTDVEMVMDLHFRDMMFLSTFCADMKTMVKYSVLSSVCSFLSKNWVFLLLTKFWDVKIQLVDQKKSS